MGRPRPRDGPVTSCQPHVARVSAPKRQRALPRGARHPDRRRARVRCAARRADASDIISSRRVRLLAPLECGCCCDVYAFIIFHVRAPRQTQTYRPMVMLMYMQKNASASRYDTVVAESEDREKDRRGRSTMLASVGIGVQAMGIRSGSGQNQG